MVIIFFIIFYLKSFNIIFSRKKDEHPKPPLQELKGLTLNKSTNSEHIPNNLDESSAPKKFNFVVMTKKGTKTQYHNMEVPISSEFANQFKAREEVYLFNYLKQKTNILQNQIFQAEKVEKEKLKQLTLNINERIVQEEFQNGN